MKPKKIVHYKPTQSDHIVKGQPAMIWPVDHPGPLVTNTKMVRTSPVTRVGVSGEFYTLNTHYVPERQ